MSRFLDNKSSVKHDFFDHDIKSNFKFLSDCISNKKILVIGGAGTIGSNYIKQILHFKPKTLMVVDQNENGLTELTRDLRSTTILDYNPVYITYPVNLLSETFNKSSTAKNGILFQIFQLINMLGQKKIKFLLKH